MGRKELIGLNELYYAYRKAKHYAFRDPNTAQGLQYADYEHRLTKRLQSLHRRLADPSAAVDDKLVGDWSVILQPSDNSQQPAHFYSSDPYLAPTIPKYRIIASASVDMQVINSLWCMTAGTRLDCALAHAHVFASHPHRGQMARFAGGEISTSRQLFQHWPTQYGRWQRQGLRRIRTALREGREIVALTMDLEKFYHQLDAQFLTSPEFLQAPNVPPITFSDIESRLNELLLSAISTWNRLVPDGPTHGLPVGWTASAVLANAALRSLDQRFLEHLSPIYYGRYVDDIFLVAEPHRAFSDQPSVMTWMEQKLDLTSEPDPQNGPGWSVTLPGLEGSRLKFSEKKLKIFCLSGEVGLDLVRPIEDAIRRRASEFRSLPSLPTSDDHLAAHALLTTTDASIDADALRKADAVSVRRHGFSLILKKADEYRQHLEPTSWSAHRRAFFGLVWRHLISPRGIAELSGYLPRVFSLAASTGDWRELRQWIRQLRRVHDKMKEGIKERPRSEQTFFDKAWQNIWTQLAEAVTTGVHDSQVEQSGATFKRLRELAGQELRDVRETWQRLRVADWLIEPRLSCQADGEPSKEHRWPRELRPRELKPLKSLKPAWSYDDMMLASRIPGLAQLHRIDIDDCTDIAAVFRGLSVLKYGRTFPRVLRAIPPKNDRPRTVQIDSRAHSGKVRLIVVSLRTGPDEWTAAAHDTPILTAARFASLTKILDRITTDAVSRNDQLATYVLLPELSVPQRWAGFFASKLAAHGVSLVAGLEYRRSARNRMVNEVMLSFAVPRLPANPVVVLQRKRQPAWGEGPDGSPRNDRSDSSLFLST